MKKFKFALSVVLSMAVIASAVFAGGVMAEEISGAASAENGLAPYFTVINDGTNKANVLGETLGVSVGDKTPDGSGFIAKTVVLSSGAYGDSVVRFHFKNAVIPEGAKALAFWFGQEYEFRTDKTNNSEMTDPDAYCLPKFIFSYKTAGMNSYKGLWSTGGTVYRVSTDDGKVYTNNNIGNATSGTPAANSNWLSFKNGWIIVPIGDGFSYAEEIDFRITVEGGTKYMKPDGTLWYTGTNATTGKFSCNTVAKFDNFGYITDMDALKKDVDNKTAAYKMGYIAKSGDITVNKAVYKNGSVNVDVTPYDAASYDVTLYSGNKAMYTKHILAGSPLTIEGVAENDYTVQVIARNENDEITAVSSVTDVTYSIDGDYNNDGKADVCDLVVLNMKYKNGTADINAVAELRAMLLAA